jgi:Spy/CpxP family protein refolding chaperone
MNMQSSSFTMARLIALVALVAIALAAVPVAAQPGEGGPWAKLDLTKEQRAKVREIMKEHREASREELHKKLSAVLTEEQLEKLQDKEYIRPGMRRGGKGTGDEPRARGHRGMRGAGRRGGCDCCCGDRGGPGVMRRGGRGMRGGPGPHMGEMRKERAGRMIERLTIALDLTDEQVAKVQDIVKEHQKQYDDFDRSKLTFDERQKTRDAHRMLLANHIKEVLTDDQKDKYDEWLETMPQPRRRGRRAR